MFYVKSEISEGITLRSEINSENVYTHCIDCGHEIQIDLDEMIVDGHLDLYGLGCRCEACSFKHAQEHRGEPWAEMVIADYLAQKKSFSCTGIHQGVNNGN